MKVADIKLGWTRSPSADVVKVFAIVTNDGAKTTTEFGPEVQEMSIVVSASKSFQFQIVTIDSEGLQSTSEIYSFTLGDLEAPQPATNLFHEVLGVREVSDSPV